MSNFVIAVISVAATIDIAIIVALIGLYLDTRE